MGLLTRLLRRPAAEPIELELFTRADCPLCDEMKVELARAAGRRDVPAFRVREVDIAGDEALTEAHGRSIPVLAQGGRPLFKGRLTVDDLGRKLRRRAESGGGGR